MNKNPDIYIMDIFNSFVCTLQEWGSFLFGKISFFRCESNNPIPISLYIANILSCSHLEIPEPSVTHNPQLSRRPKCLRVAVKWTDSKQHNMLIDLLQTFRIELSYICLSLCLLCGPLLKKWMCHVFYANKVQKFSS